MTPGADLPLDIENKEKFFNSWASRQMEKNISGSKVPGVGGEAVFLHRSYRNFVNIRPVKPPSTRGTAFQEKNFDWIEDVYSLVSKEKFEKAIDILFEQIDLLLNSGNFARCNDLLHTIDLERLDSNLIVGLLSITLPASSKLSYRSRIYQKAEDQLKILAPDRVDRLLIGLK